MSEQMNLKVDRDFILKTLQELVRINTVLGADSAGRTRIGAKGPYIDAVGYHLPPAGAVFKFFMAAPARLRVHDYRVW